MKLHFASKKGVSQGSAAAVALIAALLTACLASMNVFAPLLPNGSLKQLSEHVLQAKSINNNNENHNQQHVYLNYNFNLVVVADSINGSSSSRKVLSYIIREIEDSASLLGEALGVHIVARFTSASREHLDLLSISRCLPEEGACSTRGVATSDVVAKGSHTSKQLKNLLARRATDTCFDCIDVHIVVYDSAETLLVLLDDDEAVAASAGESAAAALRIPYKSTSLVVLCSSIARTRNAYVASLLLLLRGELVFHMFRMPGLVRDKGRDWLGDDNVLAAQAELCRRMHSKAVNLMVDFYDLYTKYRYSIRLGTDAARRWAALVDTANSLAAAGAQPCAGGLLAVKDMYAGAVRVVDDAGLGLTHTDASTEESIAIMAPFFGPVLLPMLKAVWSLLQVGILYMYLLIIPLVRLGR